jgi:heme/copper-type cytochrome/quinol oxidase subunit 3
MSSIPFQPDVPAPGHAGPTVRIVDDARGTWGMVLFIITEAMLFVVLFFAYYFVAKGNQRWQVEQPPSLDYALPEFGVLLLGSLVLYWGERQVKRNRYGSGRVAVAITILLGFLFFGLSYLDYSAELLHLTPTTDAYGSMFYTITILHDAHVILGMLMLFWLLLLSRRWEPAQHTPHRPYHNVNLFWQFLTLMWLVIVCILYIGPNVYNAL